MLKNICFLHYRWLHKRWIALMHHDVKKFNALTRIS